METGPSLNKIENPRSNIYAYLETFQLKKDSLIKAMRTLGENFELLQRQFLEMRDFLNDLEDIKAYEDPTGALKNQISALKTEIAGHFTALQQNIETQHRVSNIISETTVKIDEELRKIKSVLNRHDA